MLLAVFTKNKQKDKWLLYSVVENMEKAKKHSQEALTLAKKMGYNQPEAIVQGYSSVYDIPKMLDKPKPEKLLWN